MHQLDVSNAFLHVNLQERVLCQQPTGLEDLERPDNVCLLSRSLFGLRQAPRAWFTRFIDHVINIGFVQSRADSSLFVLRHGGGRRTCSSTLTTRYIRRLHRPCCAMSSTASSPRLQSRTWDPYISSSALRCSTHKVASSCPSPSTSTRCSSASAWLIVNQ